MNHLATARTKTESLVPASVLIPSMLALNTLTLFALDALDGIPNWIKMAAALFLAV